MHLQSLQSHNLTAKNAVLKPSLTM